MKPLAWILEVFPRSFAKRFGNEWLSVSEDVLAQARTQGRWAITRAWMTLVTDVALRAPVAHARDLRQRIVGQQPVLVGVGGGQRVLLLAKHWGVRPLGAGLNVAWRYWKQFVVGVVISLLVYWLLQDHAMWILAADMRAQVSPDNKTVLDQNLSISGRQLFFVWPAYLIALVGAIVARKRLLRRWKAHGRPIFAPIVMTLLGMIMGLHMILIGDLRQMVNENMQPFVTWPVLRDTPARGPDTIDTKDWTQAQREWFTVAGEIVRVKPERLRQWCDIKMAGLRAHQLMLSTDLNPSSDIAALLWKGRMSGAFAEGCIDDAEYLASTNAMANRLRDGNWLFQKTWEPVAFLPLIDLLTSAHYIVLPQVYLQPLTYCLSVPSQQAQSLLLLEGHVVDSSKTLVFCNGLQDQVFARRPVKNSSEPSFMWRVKHWLGVDQTSRFRENLPTPMTPTEMMWVRQQVLAQPQAWQSPAP